MIVISSAPPMMLSVRHQAGGPCRNGIAVGGAMAYEVSIVIDSDGPASRLDSGAGGHKMSEPMIVSDPKVMMGKPVVAGTRITVDLILEKLGNGESIDAVLESHPRLTREGVLAALRYAAQALRDEVVHSVGA